MTFPKQLHAIYCDDVRQEVGGKLSFMGVYRHMLIVPSFPVTLSKLNVVFNIATPVECSLSGGRCVVLKNGTTLAKLELPESLIPSEHVFSGDDYEPEENVQPQERIASLQLIVGVHGFQLDGPCLLQTRVYLPDNVEIKGQALKILASEKMSSTERH